LPKIDVLYKLIIMFLSLISNFTELNQE
jgi:hypothetical protein